MIIKGRTIVNRMDAGVNHVKIIDVRYLRINGEIKMSNGNPTIEIIFENKDKKRIALQVASTESSQWVIDSLCHCLEIDSAEIDVKKLIGKKLYIIVATEYTVHNGERKKDATGVAIEYKKVLPKFYKEEPVIEANEFIIEKEVL